MIPTPPPPASGVKRLMTSPRTVLLDVVMVSPLAPAGADAPVSSTIGAPDQPGWVVASMTSGSVIVGRADVGAMVWGPAPMAKVIVSVPRWAFVSRIAWRNDPAPESAVVVTVYAVTWGTTRT